MMPRSPASADGEYGKRREAERKDVVSLLVEKTGSFFLLRKNPKSAKNVLTWPSVFDTSVFAR